VVDKLTAFHYLVWLDETWPKSQNFDSCRCIQRWLCMA